MNKAKQKPKSRNQHTPSAQGTALSHHRDTCPAMQEPWKLGSVRENRAVMTASSHRGDSTTSDLFLFTPFLLGFKHCPNSFCYCKVTGADCGLFPLRFCPSSGMYITNAKKDKRKEKSTHR